jgi:hypothetical protein
VKVQEGNMVGIICECDDKRGDGWRRWLGLGMEQCGEGNTGNTGHTQEKRPQGMCCCAGGTWNDRLPSSLLRKE